MLFIILFFGMLNFSNSYLVPEVEILTSELGRGVYAQKNYRAGDIIEICPIITIKHTDVRGKLLDYVFGNEFNDDVSVAFGYCSLYNHKNTNSANWLIVNDTMIIEANKNIKHGDQIYVSYGDQYWNSRKNIFRL